MAEQIEHAEPTNPEESISDEAAAQKRIDQIANDAATKSTKTVQKYDKGHTIFSN